MFLSFITFLCLSLQMNVSGHETHSKICPAPFFKYILQGESLEKCQRSCKPLCKEGFAVYDDEKHLVCFNQLKYAVMISQPSVEKRDACACGVKIKRHLYGEESKIIKDPCNPSLSTSSLLSTDPVNECKRLCSSNFALMFRKDLKSYMVSCMRSYVVREIMRLEGQCTPLHDTVDGFWNCQCAVRNKIQNNEKKHFASPLSDFFHQVNTSARLESDFHTDAVPYDVPLQYCPELNIKSVVETSSESKCHDKCTRKCGGRAFAFNNSMVCFDFEIGTTMKTDFEENEPVTCECGVIFQNMLYSDPTKWTWNSCQPRRLMFPDIPVSLRSNNSDSACQNICKQHKAYVRWQHNNKRIILCKHKNTVVPYPRPQRGRCKFTEPRAYLTDCKCGIPITNAPERLMVTPDEIIYSPGDVDIPKTSPLVKFSKSLQDRMEIDAGPSEKMRAGSCLQMKDISMKDQPMRDESQECVNGPSRSTQSGSSSLIKDISMKDQPTKDVSQEHVNGSSRSTESGSSVQMKDISAKDQPTRDASQERLKGQNRSKQSNKSSQMKDISIYDPNSANNFSMKNIGKRDFHFPSVRDDRGPSVEDGSGPLVRDFKTPSVRDSSSFQDGKKSPSVRDGKKGPSVEDGKSPPVHDSRSPSALNAGSLLFPDGSGPSVENSKKPSVGNSASPSVQDSPSAERSRSPSPMVGSESPKNGSLSKSLRKKENVPKKYVSARKSSSKGICDPISRSKSSSKGNSDSISGSKSSSKENRDSILKKGNSDKDLFDDDGVLDTGMLDLVVRLHTNSINKQSDESNADSKRTKKEIIAARKYSKILVDTGKSIPQTDSEKSSSNLSGHSSGSRRKIGKQIHTSSCDTQSSHSKESHSRNINDKSAEFFRTIQATTCATSARIPHIPRKLSDTDERLQKFKKPTRFKEINEIAERDATSTRKKGGGRFGKEVEKMQKSDANNTKNGKSNTKHTDACVSLQNEKGHREKSMERRDEALTVPSGSKPDKEKEKTTKTARKPHSKKSEKQREPAQTITPATDQTGTISSGNNPTDSIPYDDSPFGAIPDSSDLYSTIPPSIGPSDIIPSGINPSGTTPSGIGPSGATPTDICPSDADPSGIGPSGTIPSSTEPIGEGQALPAVTPKKPPRSRKTNKDKEGATGSPKKPTPRKRNPKPKKTADQSGNVSQLPTVPQPSQHEIGESSRRNKRKNNTTTTNVRNHPEVVVIKDPSQRLVMKRKQNIQQIKSTLPIDLDPEDPKIAIAKKKSPNKASNVKVVGNVVHLDDESSEERKWRIKRKKNKQNKLRATDKQAPTQPPIRVQSSHSNTSSVQEVGPSFSSPFKGAGPSHSNTVQRAGPSASNTVQEMRPTLSNPAHEGRPLNVDPAQNVAPSSSYPMCGQSHSQSLAAQEQSQSREAMSVQKQSQSREKTPVGRRLGSNLDLNMGQSPQRSIQSRGQTSSIRGQFPLDLNIDQSQNQRQSHSQSSSSNCGQSPYYLDLNANPFLNTIPDPPPMYTSPNHGLTRTNLDLNIVQSPDSMRGQAHSNTSSTRKRSRYNLDLNMNQSPQSSEGQGQSHTSPNRRWFHPNLDLNVDQSSDPSQGRQHSHTSSVRRRSHSNLDLNLNQSPNLMQTQRHASASSVRERFRSNLDLNMDPSENLGGKQSNPNSSPIQMEPSKSYSSAHWEQSRSNNLDQSNNSPMREDSPTSRIRIQDSDGSDLSDHHWLKLNLND